jgi:hypothetical protein
MRLRAPAVTLAADYLPAHDVAMRHQRRVAAPAAAVWDALHRADLGRSPVTRALLVLRGLRRPGAARPPLTLATLDRAGFVPLGERPGREIAFGLVGRFWTPSGGRVAVMPAEFRDFARPGYAKAVWTFAVEDEAPGVTRLVTETRVACVDAASRRWFRLYWLLVRPFSGLIRRAMLRAVAREAARARV